MRFTIPALNNDYFDEDYLRVFNFKSMGKNVKAHRSVVFMDPSKVSIGDNVTIGPYCVFGAGETLIDEGAQVPPFSHFPGMESLPEPDAETRIKELEAELARIKDDGKRATEGPDSDLRSGRTGA